MVGSRDPKPLSGVLGDFLGPEEQEQSLCLVTGFWLLHRFLNCLVLPGFLGSMEGPHLFSCHDQVTLSRDVQPTGWFFEGWVSLLCSVSSGTGVVGEGGGFGHQYRSQPPGKRGLYMVRQEHRPRRHCFAFHWEPVLRLGPKSVLPQE